MRARHFFICAPLVLAVLAGCGSAGDPSFSSDKFPLSFSYPSGWTLTQSAPSPDSAGSALRAVSVALKDPFDQVSISQYRLKKKLPAGANGFRPEVDRVINRLTDRSGGKASQGKVVSYAGIPGYQYTISYSAAGEKLENRLTFLFSGSDQFVVGCQSAAENRAQLNRGCEQILESLELD